MSAVRAGNLDFSSSLGNTGLFFAGGAFKIPMKFSIFQPVPDFLESLFKGSKDPQKRPVFFGAAFDVL